MYAMITPVELNCSCNYIMTNKIIMKSKIINKYKKLIETKIVKGYNCQDTIIIILWCNSYYDLLFEIKILS